MFRLVCILFFVKSLTPRVRVAFIDICFYVATVLGTKGTGRCNVPVLDVETNVEGGHRMSYFQIRRPRLPVVD